MFVPVNPSQSTSPFAMELGQKLTTVIDEYRKTHPGLSGREIRDALRIARAGSGSDAVSRNIVLAITVALILAGAIVGYVQQGGPGAHPRTGAPPAFLPLIAVAIVVSLIVLRKSRS